MPSSKPVAVVTGAAHGIGRAIALSLGRSGFSVGVLDLDENGAGATAAELCRAGADAVGVHCDVRSAASVRSALDAVRSAYGRLDSAVNNAGLGTKAVDLADLTEQDWDLVLDVDLRGVYLSMKYELPHLLETPDAIGSIVNIASAVGLTGSADNSPAYVAAKHGVVGLTKSAALQYATRGIRVNAVCPGVIDTPGLQRRLVRTGPEDARQLQNKQAMERMGDPGEVAAAVTWLCGRTATFVTGTAIPVDGGWTAR
ncbi:SDR family oxidoreductase [Nocardia sp. R6R-6]|uniref:SDR family oxidoreductase n=1 Tax=Nocardia sp. R6R-6 TaxID=3459303 RepID=UPI00403DC89D